MAVNLKKQERDDKKAAARAEKGERAAVDLKLLAAGLGLAMIVMGSVVVGMQLSAKYFFVKEITKTQYVEKLPPKPGPIFQLVSDQVVNLNGGRYLRFTASLQFAANEKIFKESGGEHGKAASPLAPYEALMKDAIVTVASRHSADELLKPSGKERLKEEIKHEINVQLGGFNVGMEESEAKEHPVPEAIRVYFTNFVVS